MRFFKEKLISIKTNIGMILRRIEPLDKVWMGTESHEVDNVVISHHHFSHERRAEASEPIKEHFTPGTMFQFPLRFTSNCARLPYGARFYNRNKILTASFSLSLPPSFGCARRPWLQQTYCPFSPQPSPWCPRVLTMKQPEPSEPGRWWWTNRSTHIQFRYSVADVPLESP